MSATKSSKCKVYMYKQSYSITYDANGGTGAPSSQTKLHDTTLVLSSTKPTNDGYRFLGWATSSTGNVEYQPSGNYTANDNVTLYAKWESSNKLWNKYCKQLR